MSVVLKARAFPIYVKRQVIIDIKYDMRGKIQTIHAFYILKLLQNTLFLLKES